MPEEIIETELSPPSKTGRRYHIFKDGIEYSKDGFKKELRKKKIEWKEFDKHCDSWAITEDGNLVESSMREDKEVWCIECGTSRNSRHKSCPFCGSYLKEEYQEMW